MIITKYLSKPNYIPAFNEGFNNYSIKDEEAYDDLIIRTIEADTLPTYITFNNEGGYHSLIEVYELNISNITDLSNLFYGCDKLRKIHGIEDWDVSKVTNMKNLFYYCYSLESLDLSNWDVSKVENMEGMFYSTYDVKSFGDLSKWDVGNVTNMNGMFAISEGSRAYQYKTLGIEKWDVRKVKTMNSMFGGFDCVPGLELDLSSWNTESLENIDDILSSCSAVTKLDISNFKLKPTIVTDFDNLVTRAYSLNELKGLKNMNFFTDTAYFYGLIDRCYALEKLEATNISFCNIDLNGYNFPLLNELLLLRYADLSNLSLLYLDFSIRPSSLPKGDDSENIEEPVTMDTLNIDTLNIEENINIVNENKEQPTGVISDEIETYGSSYDPGGPEQEPYRIICEESKYLKHLILSGLKSKSVIFNDDLSYTETGEVPLNVESLRHCVSLEIVELEYTEPLIINQIIYGLPDRPNDKPGRLVLTGVDVNEVDLPTARSKNWFC